MNLDIVFVTYNSEKWIDNCLKSILNSKFDLSKISILVTDNASNDDTVLKLEEFKEKYQDLFNQISIFQAKKNYGFGVGNNKAARLGNSEYILFLNIDTEIFPETLSNLEKEIENSSEQIGAWELRQLPYEHPKYFDPIDGSVTWMSGACMVVRRNVFRKVHGFSRMLFMYAEDVEISWHIRQKGYQLKYLPNVSIKHFSYSKPNEFKETQYIYSVVNNLFLRYRYGYLRSMIKGNLLVGKRFLRNYLKGIVTDEKAKEIQKKIRNEYLKTQFKAFILIPANYISRIFSHDFKPIFKDFDYEGSKLDPFYVSENLETGPLVSVIIRTCGRPDVLSNIIRILKLL